MKHNKTYTLGDLRGYAFDNGYDFLRYRGGSEIVLRLQHGGVVVDCRFVFSHRIKKDIYYKLDRRDIHYGANEIQSNAGLHRRV